MQSQAQGRWTAIVLAGQRPGVDPLAASFGQDYKALVPVNGEPMLALVLRALLAAPSIGRIVVLAQDPEVLLTGQLAWAATDPRITGAAGIAGISDSVRAIAGTAAAPWPILLTTADHPLLTPAMIEAFVGQAGDCEVAVGAVERATLLARYPGSERTWLRFADGAYSGANLFALRGDGARHALALWARAEQDRKQAFKLFWHFGPVLALRAASRTIGLGDALRRAGRKLGIAARLIPLDFAEAAIDVDKLGDHRLVEQILLARQAAAADDPSLPTAG